MKRALLIALLCGSGVAYAQSAGVPAPGSAAVAPGAAGSAVTGNGGPAPDMKSPVDKERLADPAPSAPAGAPAAATPSAAGAPPATGGPAAGTAPATGAPATAAPKGPVEKAWFDKLADLPIQESGNFWMPKAVNRAADDSDMMYYVCLGLSAFFFLAIAIAVIYFTIRYRHRPGHKAEPSPAHNDALEVTWTVIPTIIVVFLFWYGWRAYVEIITPPAKAVEIDVLAWRWNWQFTHTNGVTDSDLHVPVNTPVRLVMTSKDVLHSFYAPAMRVKQDVVPRRFTYAWFEATKPGTYRLTCAEYCGTSHAQMACLEIDKETGACLRRAVVVVHEPGDYERYLNDKASESSGATDPVAFGRKLFDKKGCVACHTIDGSAKVGPTWASKDWNKMIPLAGGGEVKMDENYIRESILAPTAKARPGFPVGQMPSFEGQLKDKEMLGLIAFIKSLKE